MERAVCRRADTGRVVPPTSRVRESGGRRTACPRRPHRPAHRGTCRAVGVRVVVVTAHTYVRRERSIAMPGVITPSRSTVDPSRPPPTSFERKRRTARETGSVGSQRELRLALGMRGGVSLSVWIGGACAEVDELRTSLASEAEALPPFWKQTARAHRSRRGCGRHPRRHERRWTQRSHLRSGSDLWLPDCEAPRHLEQRRPDRRDGAASEHRHALAAPRRWLHTQEAERRDAATRGRSRDEREGTRARRAPADRSLPHRDTRGASAKGLAERAGRAACSATGSLPASIS